MPKGHWNLQILEKVHLSETHMMEGKRIGKKHLISVVITSV